MAKRVGADGIELFPEEHWPLLREYDLKCPVALLNYGPETAPFAIGWNNSSHRKQVTSETRRLIEQCRESNGVCDGIIAFSGMAHKQRIGRRIDSCIKGIRNVVAAAEDAGVTLLFEPLNNKIHEDWRGHPGYDASWTGYAEQVCDGVGSDRCKILHDLYHRQVMEGDLTASLRMYASKIGHVHVAGIGGSVPRAEMNTFPQELDWRGLGGLIRAVCPNVWVGIEYIPTEGRPYEEDLAAAVRLLRGE